VFHNAAASAEAVTVVGVEGKPSAVAVKRMREQKRMNNVRRLGA